MHSQTQERKRKPLISSSSSLMCALVRRLIDGSIININDIRKDHLVSASIVLCSILSFFMLSNFPSLALCWLYPSNNSICNAYYTQNEMFLPSMEDTPRDQLLEIQSAFSRRHFLLPSNRRLNECRSKKKSVLSEGRHQTREEISMNWGEEVNWRRRAEIPQLMLDWISEFSSNFHFFPPPALLPTANSIL